MRRTPCHALGTQPNPRTGGGCRVGSMTTTSTDVAFVVSCTTPSGPPRHFVVVRG